MRLRVTRAGFTFIEIFIVMAIIGVLAGVVILHSISADRARDVETEARRLAELIELARAEAVSGNESWGVFVDQTRYGFLVHDELASAWRAASKSTFRTRNTPEGVVLSLQQSDWGASSRQLARGQDGQATEEEEGDANPRIPQVLILASGEQTPFLISIRAGGHPPWSVTSDGISRTRASRADQPEERT
ncbi:MAG: type II secretion system minor pseudopilin GspH [Gammaproteobacteria bacterium]|nr:type II secretion system minor pseudopilin GspH [Gammaproteobacteria bacterium]